MEKTKKTFVFLGTVEDSYYGERKVAAVYGGDLYHGTIGSPEAGDAKWHLAMYGAFDRNMIGAYWWPMDREEAKQYPGLWERYQAAIK